MSADLSEKERETIERCLAMWDPEPAAMVRRLLEAYDAAEEERERLLESRAHNTETGTCACGSPSGHESGWCGWCGTEGYARVGKLAQERGAAEARACAAEAMWAGAEERGFRAGVEAAAEVADEELGRGYGVGNQIRALTPPAASPHNDKEDSWDRSRSSETASSSVPSMPSPASAGTPTPKTPATRAARDAATDGSALTAGAGSSSSAPTEPAAAEPREPAQHHEYCDALDIFATKPCNCWRYKPRGEED